MKNILIIDDDVHIGNVLEEILVKEGYGVFRAYSGTEALLVLSQSKPDLVLLDLMLPGLNGEEVLPQIHGIPVIITSAKVDRHQPAPAIPASPLYAPDSFRTPDRPPESKTQYW